jgi:hypothetical protein
MEFMGSKRGTTFSIETSSYLNLILNEKIREALGFEFDRISSWNLQFG